MNILTLPNVYEYFIINFNFTQSKYRRNIIELDYKDRIVYLEP